MKSTNLISFPITKYHFLLCPPPAAAAATASKDSAMASKPAGLHSSHLLAALHAGMERIKSVLKVCRAASKKPHNTCVVVRGQASQQQLMRKAVKVSWHSPN